MIKSPSYQNKVGLLGSVKLPKKFREEQAYTREKREAGGSKTEIFVRQQNKLEGHKLVVGFKLLSLTGEVSVQILIHRHFN